ncbi:hypothetical protein OSB04_012600 [Centaurea solstitialis]|uniref:DUF659 domain-containing protein n=1 Tax=Centaurea solstitialis TaxID=347529 RepID=A0AA38TPM7_9ASTR|nr:hypothetical protein OSB04_012600 [Centaurea solstitialis]
MEGGSSRASTTPNTTNTIASIATPRVVSNGDPTWEWGYLKSQVEKSGIIWWKLCDKRMSGVVTRMKKHLVHKTGQVKGCLNVTPEIQKKVWKILHDKDKKKKESLRNAEILEKYSLGSDEDEDADDDQQKEDDVREVVDVEKAKSKAKRKKRKAVSDVRGPLDAMLKPNFEKMKQATLGKNNPIKEQLKMNAWKKFVIWSYSVGLLFNAVRDESFQDAIHAIGEYGEGSMHAPSYNNIRVTLLNDVLADTRNFVGEEYIVQFVTDNGSNFKAMAKILEQQHPKLFWTSCAAHCVNLMLGDIGEKILKIKTVLAEARAIVAYIYNHGRILNMLRRLTGNKELHRSCVTRFATQFYTIKSFFENQNSIQVLFVSESWTKSDFAKKAYGKRVERIVAKSNFWDNVYLACQVMAHLVDVVRLVDTEERPCMGYIYDAMDKANEQIKKNLTVPRAGYYLNPAIYYGPIKTGLYVAIDRLVVDEEENDKLRQELDLHIDARGQFGSAATIRSRSKVAPFLSQTCSASPCERNWSAFDNLERRSKSLKNNKSLDPIVLRDVEENDDWVIPTAVDLQEFVDASDGLL